MSFHLVTLSHCYCHLLSQFNCLQRPAVHLPYRRLGVSQLVRDPLDAFHLDVVPAKDRPVKRILECLDRGLHSIERFDLRRPIYKQTAAYGHMGREDLNLPWEKCDLAPAMKAALL